VTTLRRVNFQVLQTTSLSISNMQHIQCTRSITTAGRHMSNYFQHSINYIRLPI